MKKSSAMLIHQELGNRFHHILKNTLLGITLVLIIMGLPCHSSAIGIEPPPTGSPAIDLEILVNDTDTSTSPVSALVGSPVTWEYRVANVGDVDLSSVSVVDNANAPICVMDNLAVGESKSCTRNGIAAVGGHMDMGTASGEYDATTVADTAVGQYFGADPSIDIENSVSLDGGKTWYDADSPPGPQTMVGSSVLVKFVVTNSHNVNLTDITLSDSIYDESVCSVPSVLASGASFECQVGPFPALYGNQSNTTTVAGVWEGTTWSDSDSANYAGSYTFAACTPGYWKNHPESWAGHSTDDVVSDVFLVPGSLPDYLRNSTLLQALQFKGGNTLAGAAEILLRAAVAGLLDAAHAPETSYPLSESEIVGQVNAALATQDRATLINLGKQLDRYNNGACPLN